MVLTPASRRVPGPAERRRQPPGNVRRVDVRPDRRGARRAGATQCGSGEPWSSRSNDGDIPDRPLRRRSRARDVRRPDRRAARSAVRPSSTSRRRSGWTSGTAPSASGCPNDTTAMMGGGLCWLDYDRDGWLDLFVVNSYAQADISAWEARGGLPRSALYRNVRRAVRGRERRSRRRSPGPRERVRRRRLRPRRPHGSLRDDRRVQRADGRVRRAALERRRRDVHGGRAGRPGSTRLAGTRARRSETSTATGCRISSSPATPTRTGRSPPRPPASRRTTTPCATSCTSTRAQARTAGSTFREVGEARRHRAAAARPRARRGVHRLRPRRAARPVRRQRRGPEPAVPERPARRRGSGSGLEEVGEAVGASTTRTRAWASPPPTSAGTAAPTSFVTNSRRQLHAAYRSRVVRSGARRSWTLGPTLAAGIGTRSTGWGASWADLDLDGDLDLVVANGAIPVVDLAKDAQRIQVLENARESGTGAAIRARSKASALERSPRVNGRGLAAADYDNDGDVDVAVNSIGGRLILLETRGASAATGSRCGSAASRRERWSRPCSRTADGSFARCSRAAATSPPRIPACTSVSARRPRRASCEVRFPDGSVSAGADVAADRIVVVGAG